MCDRETSLSHISESIPLFASHPYPPFMDAPFEEVLYGAAGAAGGCAGAGTGAGRSTGTGAGVVRRSPARTGGTG